MNLKAQNDLTWLCIVGKFLSLPLNRVRQIINLDQEENMNFSKEALLMVGKATEIFVHDLGGVVAQIAKA